VITADYRKQSCSYTGASTPIDYVPSDHRLWPHDDCRISNVGGMYLFNDAEYCVSQVDSLHKTVDIAVADSDESGARRPNTRGHDRRRQAVDSEPIEVDGSTA